MIKTITLDAEFANSNGKSQHLHLKNFDPTKTAEEIKASLTKLTKLDLFEKDGVGLFKEVLHATVREKIVEPIFDDRKKVKKQTKDPLTRMMEAAMGQTQTKPLPKKAEALPPQTEPVEPMESLENIRIPQDLTILEERPEPDVLIQTIELPKGINPWKLDENQAFSLILACMPPHTSLINVVVDDQSVPARLIVTEKIEQEQVPLETSEITQSPPEKPKRLRKRLLDRIRRRE
ncbi:hypothetical protein SAMN04487821_10767 [Enterococcus malodoratus]|uniref:DUF2922 family protein n=1 Tax=Enterococcus malodoratus TaxID=71451 RepID=UPI0008C4F1DB|nr:DUF2922 family protein [Enterococcus malodoratus]SET17085.1 hypothetical protein SAMN04487821_10767 [Enterococcus malodoratus]